ncbi:MAG: Helicase associated domain protein [Cloacibacillus sp.]
MIGLFKHNQIAYESAALMLRERGKAAVIHPTGTGKSFIGFKLAEDNPEATVCWLSPSENIFKTQIENLQATGGVTPRNIRFFTYARLMLMGEHELSALRPAYIILDEFHRCGAQAWGVGVRKLLDMYTESQILGFSATNIRYLDNQRDMADELFDGNIASQMTLGEVVVRGILAPPTYVISLYSCQKDLERYQFRVKGAKNKVVRDEAQKRLDALRRQLEKSEGLDVIFQKHITDTNGKYIVFCSNVEHLKEAICHIHEWFGKVDNNPRIYKVYADDPATSKSFAAFKTDKSAGLKLLLCIDMLNEGVHIDDISGVILFRPTVSPIIYKQQIGRALSAGSPQKTVIIDVVNNIENLYSISVLQEEMCFAIESYNALGENSLVVNDSFTIIDEARDSRLLFNELEEMLSTSWEIMFSYARAYYNEHGHLDVPKRYRTPEGCSLGSWLNTQRLVRSGKIPGILGNDRIAQLDSIAMRWKNRYEYLWERYYDALCRYRSKNGNIDICADYVTPDGLELGKYLCNLRQSKNNGRRGCYLTDERIAVLNKLGMIWDKLDYIWEKNYLACAEYYLIHHHLNIPAGYIDPNGMRIGAWVSRMRKIRSGRLYGSAPLTASQIERLDAIQMDWVDAYTRRWAYGYEQAVAYYREFGSLDVPLSYVNKNGFPLGGWLKNHVDVNSKTGRTSIKVTPERRAKLDELGFKWTAEDSWQTRITACREYLMEHGDLAIPAHYVVGGIWLGKWLYECRRMYRGELKGKKLTNRQIQQLEELGVDWRTPFERAWCEKYKTAERLLEARGNINVANCCKAEDEIRIEQWMARQKILCKHGKLSREQIEKLNALNITKTATHNNPERMVWGVEQ